MATVPGERGSARMFPRCAAAAPQGPMASKRPASDDGVAPRATRARLSTVRATGGPRHPPAKTGPTQPNKSSKAGRRAIAAQAAVRA